MPELKHATTLKGIKIRRRERILVPQFGREIPCAPYDDHFIFYTAKQYGSAFLCTCGSPAVVVLPEDGSSVLLVCLFHACNGVHATGGSKWV